MQSAAHKHRDIARSILPSKAPRPVRRDLAATRRHLRRSVRSDLRTLRSDGRDGRAVADAHDDSPIDLRRTADIDINQIRRYRRGADKLNHFERWAVEVTKHMPVEDRLGFLRGILPGGLIGDHAMSHLEDLAQLNPDGWWVRTQARWRAEAEARVARRLDDRRRLADDLRRALEHGAHAPINAALRSADEEDRPPLRLLGPHGVDALVDALLPAPPMPPGRSYPVVPDARRALGAVLDVVRPPDEAGD